MAAGAAQLTETETRQLQNLRELVGQDVVFSPQAHRTERNLTHLPLRVEAVRREKKRARVTLRGPDRWGDIVCTSDRFDLCSAAGRYVVPRRTYLPFRADGLRDAWTCRADPDEEEEVCARKKELGAPMPLEDVLPLFRSVADEGTDINRHCRYAANFLHGGMDFAWGRDMGMVQYVLSCCTQSLPSDGLFEVHHKGLHFQTSDAPTMREARACRRRRKFLEDAFALRPGDAARERGAGMVELWPWQAATAAAVRDAVEAGDARVYTVKTVLGVRVEALVTPPKRVTLIHAAPGKGKTIAASLVAFGRFALCVTEPGCAPQWEADARRLGLVAQHIDGMNATLTRAQASLAARPDQLWILSRTLVKHHRTRLRTALPRPSLVVFDEVHSSLGLLSDCMRSWPLAHYLGVTATLTRSDMASLACVCNMDVDVLEACTLRVPDSTASGVYPPVRVEIQHVAMTHMEALAYAAGQPWMSETQRLRLLIFPPTERSGARRRVYGEQVWSSILKQLSSARSGVTERVFQVLQRAPNRECLRSGIEERLGAETTEALYERVLAAPPPLSMRSMPESESQLSEAWQRQDHILGGYAFLSRELQRVQGVETLECPVCYEDARAFAMGQCGHTLCLACSAHTAARCPICRQNAPHWCAAVTTLADAARGDPASAEERALETRAKTTSSKLQALTRILGDLEAWERVLVVCPAGELLKDVHAELVKAGCLLGRLDGPPAEQERTLRTWNAGRLRGLLCIPGVLGIDLSGVSTIVFLSPVMSDEAFRQAAARAVRQGNDAVRSSRAVRVVILCYAGSEETVHEERLRRLEGVAEALSQLGGADSDEGRTSP